MNINEIFAHVDELFENKRANEVEPYLLSCLAEAEAAGDPALIPICNEELIMPSKDSQKKLWRSLKKLRPC